MQDNTTALKSLDAKLTEQRKKAISKG